MKILSIDPSIANIGYAFYDSYRKEILLGTFHTKTDLLLEDRIAVICREISKLIYELTPDQAVIEAIPEYTRKAYGGKSLNHGSLMRLCRAVGAIEAMFLNSGIPIYQSPALKLSKAGQKIYAVEIYAGSAKASEHARAALLHLDRFCRRKGVRIESTTA